MSNAATFLSAQDIYNIFPQLSDRYKLLDDEPIGRPSGFGAVWRAIDTWIEQIVAIKISDSNLSDEVKLCRNIGGQTIRVYEYFKNKNWNAYSMELLETPWKTVEDFIEKSNYRKNRLQHYFDSFHIGRSILNALSEIHGSPYSRKGRHVHADVQPRNIFIWGQKKNNDHPISKLPEGRDFVKIIDLGLTVQKGEYHNGQHLLYADPRRRTALPGDDLYSLAIVMLELMTGVCPSHEQMKNNSQIFDHLYEYSSGSQYLDAIAVDFINMMARAATNKSITAEKVIAFIEDNIFDVLPELILSIKTINKTPDGPHGKSELAEILFPVYSKIYGWKNRSEDRTRFIKSRIVDMVDFDMLFIKGHKYSLKVL